MQVQLVVLNDNTVLAIGGENGGYDAPPPYNFTVFTSCEVFHPATGTWSATGAMATPQFSHRATLLPSGRVLVAGGLSTETVPSIPTASAEIYDPATGLWSPAHDMPFARFIFEMQTLPSGLVFMGGGNGFVQDGGYDIFGNDTAIYNENTNTWTTGTKLLYANTNDNFNPNSVLYSR